MVTIETAPTERPVSPRGSDDPIKLAVTIDVEEEGLFSGTYPVHNVSVTNVSRLTQLTPIFSKLGIRPTLFVTYQVARNGECRQVLLKMSDDLNGELGAHLHHWNTPPLVNLPYRDPVPSELMSVKLLSEKLATLLGVLGEMGVIPTSFRMGRYNLGPKMFAALNGTSITVDSSIAPMMRFYGGPDHLAAPADPYFPNPQDPCVAGDSDILEVPVTMIPVIKGLGSFLAHLNGSGFGPLKGVSWLLQEAGRLSTQPMDAGLFRLKAAVRLHRSRGGQVVTVAFHSSELMPGGCPKHRTLADVGRFLDRMDRFLSWLRIGLGAEPVTISELMPMRAGKRKISGGNPFAKGLSPGPPS